MSKAKAARADHLGDLPADRTSPGRVHELKTWPEPFEAILRGRKTAEFRRDDGGGFATGDRLLLREWVPDGGYYTGRSLLVEVTDLQRGLAWGIPEGYVMMSIRLVRTETGTAASAPGQ